MGTVRREVTSHNTATVDIMTARCLHEVFSLTSIALPLLIRSISTVILGA